MNDSKKIIVVLLILSGICSMSIIGFIQTDSDLMSLKPEVKNQAERIRKLENTVSRLISGWNNKANKKIRLLFPTVNPNNIQKGK